MKFISQKQQNLQSSEFEKFSSLKQELMGSVFEITLPEKNSKLFSLCFNEISRIEKKFSRFIHTSDLSIANKHLNEWHEIDEEFMFLIAKSLDYNEKTDGAFDITVKSKLDELGYDENYSFKEKVTRKNLLSNVKDKFFSPITIKGKKILLRKQIDFGGIGKGYALNQVSELLHRYGVFDYCINAGGDIVAKRLIPSESWNIALEHPDDNTRAIGLVKVNGFSVAGSSSNRRRWGKNHHLINPKTGKPEDSVKCTFILSKSGMDADVYSTSIFVSGFEKGTELAEELSKKFGVEVLIVSSQNKMFKTKGFDAEIFD